MSQGNRFKHWPTMLLAVVVAVIMFAVIFTFQVSESDSVVVTTFGRIETETPEPGLHWRWPYPIQDIYRFDNRARCFEGNEGKLEETITADGQNILVGIFAIYQISDAAKFFTKLETIEKAEQDLNVWMRGAKNAAFGRYRFDQLINADSSKMQLKQLSDDILADVRSRADEYGITIKSVGINTLNLPQSISNGVYERMISERNIVAERYLGQGRTEAAAIRTKADSDSQRLLAEAQAQAKEIQSQGDAEAASYYGVFTQNPELAMFLRKIDSLQRIMKSKTTLIMSTDQAPFDIMRTGADKLAVPQK